MGVSYRIRKEIIKDTIFIVFHYDENILYTSFFDVCKFSAHVMCSQERKSDFSYHQKIVFSMRKIC